MTSLPSPLCPCCLFYNTQCHWTLLTTPFLYSLPLNSLALLGLAFSVPSWGISVFLPLLSEHPSSFTSIWPVSWVLLILSVHFYCLHRLPHCRPPLYGPNHCTHFICLPPACPHPSLSHTQSILCLGAHTFRFHDNVCLSFLSQYHFRRYSLLIIISLCVPGHPDTCREVSKLLPLAFLIDYPKRTPQLIN